MNSLISLLRFGSEVTSGLMRYCFQTTSTIFGFTLFSFLRHTKKFKTNCSHVPKVCSAQVRWQHFTCSHSFHLSLMRIHYTCLTPAPVTLTSSVKAYSSTFYFCCQPSRLLSLNSLRWHHPSDPRWTAKPYAVRKEGYASDSQRKHRWGKTCMQKREKYGWKYIHKKTQKHKT